MIRQELTKHDPEKRRKAKRSGKERGVWVYVSAHDLRTAKIDPHGPPPEYKCWPDKTKKGGVRLRLYEAVE